MGSCQMTLAHTELRRHADPAPIQKASLPRSTNTTRTNCNCCIVIRRLRKSFVNGRLPSRGVLNLARSAHSIGDPVRELDRAKPRRNDRAFWPDAPLDLFASGKREAQCRALVAGSSRSIACEGKLPHDLSLKMSAHLIPDPARSIAF